MDLAYSDQLLPLKQRNGWMHCFCRDQLYEGWQQGLTFSESMEIEFANGEYYCEEWFPKYVVDNLMIILVPLIIIIINFISKTILRLMTKFERSQSRP